MIPISYGDDRARVEQILLDAAHAHAVVDDEDARRALAQVRSRYALADASLDPSVFWRLTDNWIELSLRFLVRPRGVREIKDRISRDVLGALDEAGIGIASATYGIVKVPPLELLDPRSRDRTREPIPPVNPG